MPNTRIGWIGVDLDGTLAVWAGDRSGAIGPPVPKMVKRVKRWLREGTAVRVVSARVAEGEPGAAQARKDIAAWCREHVGAALPVTAEKDFGMLELWDDRAVQVVPNTGLRVDGVED